MANQVYDNFFLSNEVEDQYNSHLDLQQFCTVDNTLVGSAGMKRVINTYRATDGTEKLVMGAGNTKSIEVNLSDAEYEIALAQNRFQYYDEQAMTDPNIVPVGMKHAGTDLYNTMNADIFAEFNKTGVEVPATAFGFDAFVDASAALNLENLEDVTIFAFFALLSFSVLCIFSLNISFKSFFSIFDKKPRIVSVNCLFPPNLNTSIVEGFLFENLNTFPPNPNETLACLVNHLGITSTPSLYKLRSSVKLILS